MNPASSWHESTSIIYPQSVSLAYLLFFFSYNPYSLQLPKCARRSPIFVPLHILFLLPTLCIFPSLYFWKISYFSFKTLLTHCPLKPHCSRVFTTPSSMPLCSSYVLWSLYLSLCGVDYLFTCLALHETVNCTGHRLDMFSTFLSQDTVDTW